MKTTAQALNDALTAGARYTFPPWAAVWGFAVVFFVLENDRHSGLLLFMLAALAAIVYAGERIQRRRCAAAALATAINGDHAGAFAELWRNGSAGEVQLALLLWLHDALRAGELDTARALVSFAQQHVRSSRLYNRVFAETALLDQRARGGTAVEAELTVALAQLPPGPLREHVQAVRRTMTDRTA